MTRPTMRRTGALAGCLVLLLGAAGCDGKAREFAQRTAALLKQALDAHDRAVGGGGAA